MQKPLAVESNFGTYLAFLRKRARLTQGELGRAVGYSREQITRLERNQRAPDPAILSARFVPALGLTADSPLAMRLLELAGGFGSAADTNASNSSGGGVVQVPAPLLPLIGRAPELKALKERLRGDRARLVTLLGPAGVGKTRLAIQAALALSPAFRDGVYFVSLASITQSAHMAGAVLKVLEPDTVGITGPDEYLVSRVAEKQLLLVLDNLEQLDGADKWVADLMSAAPRMQLLATSRAPLVLYGEFQFPLAPLALPAPDESRSLDALARIPSVALFVARTRQVLPEFTLTAENATDIAALCVLLDGLPLALELAAAQMNRFSPAELRAGLAADAIHYDFPARNVPERHHSLTNALAWSYDHLEPQVQRVFETLGVFPGGATVEFLERLVPAPGVQAALDTLTQVSLAQTRTAASETRYTLFETVRQFARDKLRARGKLDDLQEKHAGLYVELAERAEPHLSGADQQEWLDLLERERDNWRSALTILLAPGHLADRALVLCNGLWKFWRYRCDLGEGYEWTTRALALAGTGTDVLELRAGAEWGAGVLAAAMEREQAATTHLEASLALWQTLEDDMGVAAALTALGARAMDRGDFEHAVNLQTQALGLYTGLGDAAAMAYVHNALGETHRAAGALERSRAHYRASLELARAAAHGRSIAVAGSNLASVEFAMGNSKLAHDQLLEALPTFVSLDDRVNIASCIATLACIRSLTAETEGAAQAARWFGFATALIRRAGGRFEAADASEFALGEERCRVVLGAAGYKAAWRAGSVLELESVVKIIMNEKP